MQFVVGPVHGHHRADASRSARRRDIVHLDAQLATRIAAWSALGVCSRLTPPGRSRGSAAAAARRARRLRAGNRSAADFARSSGRSRAPDPRRLERIYTISPISRQARPRGVRRGFTRGMTLKNVSCACVMRRRASPVIRCDRSGVSTTVSRIAPASRRNSRLERDVNAYSHAVRNASMIRAGSAPASSRSRRQIPRASAPRYAGRRLARCPNFAPYGAYAGCRRCGIGDVATASALRGETDELRESFSLIVRALTHWASRPLRRNGRSKPNPASRTASSRTARHRVVAVHVDNDGKLEPCT